MGERWTNHERDFIRLNADTMKDSQIANELSRLTGRTIQTQSVRKQRQKLGIRKLRGRGYCQVVKEEVENDAEKSGQVVSNVN